jgi:hypothetical protein
MNFLLRPAAGFRFLFDVELSEKLRFDNKGTRFAAVAKAGSGRGRRGPGGDRFGRSNPGVGPFLKIEFITNRLA